MNYTTLTYGIYILISFALTIWVAQTLFRNGRIFVLEAFGGNEKIADSVNHLLLVGFYLLNLGFVTLFLKIGFKPANITEVIECISTKIGIVLLVLGGMHYFNVYNFAKLRKKAKNKSAPENKDDSLPTAS